MGTSDQWRERWHSHAADAASIDNTITPYIHVRPHTDSGLALADWLAGAPLAAPSLTGCSPPLPAASPVALQVPQAQLLAGELKVPQAHAPQPRVERRQAGGVHLEGSHLQRQVEG